jgi:hypothetical protein
MRIERELQVERDNGGKRRSEVRNVQTLATQENRSRDGASPDGDLLTWGAMDFLASSVRMFAAFTGRSINRCCSDRVAEERSEA